MLLVMPVFSVLWLGIREILFINLSGQTSQRLHLLFISSKGASICTALSVPALMFL